MQNVIDLKQRDTHDMALWIAEIAADGMEPEERKRALELLRKQIGRAHV